MSALGPIADVVGGFAARAHSRVRARMLNRDAAFAKEAADSEARSILRDAREAEASGTVAAASSGFTIGGSALDVLSWMAQTADANAGRARLEGARRAHALRTEAAVTRAEGNLAAFTGVARGVSNFANMQSSAASAAGKSGGRIDAKN